MQSPNNSQMKAIKHGMGPMLVLAGPGSGKTFVIIQRILNLIHEKKVKPENILVISFSKASTFELKQRFQRESKHQVNFFTFHACFFHILKETYHYTSQDIITEKQKRELLRTILLNIEHEGAEPNSIWKNTNVEKNKEGIEKADIRKPVQDEIKNLTEITEDYLQKISYYKNKGIKELEEKESNCFFRIYHEYNHEMHRMHKLDFDDMGLLCLQLFQSEPEILKKWQDKFQFVLIDEFQDINLSQFRIMHLLTRKHKNLFVVGDDDQAIYGFRGSNPQIMLNFEKYYPKAEKVLLEINYRCSEDIVKESLNVIEQNQVRFQKEVRAFHSGKKEQTGRWYKRKGYLQKEDVIYLGFEDYQKEYFYMGEQIKKMATEYKYNDIACIFRTNQDMAGLAEYFARNKIPFVMKEDCSSIFKHFIAKDLLAYLQFFFRRKKEK